MIGYYLLFAFQVYFQEANLFTTQFKAMTQISANELRLSNLIDYEGSIAKVMEIGGGGCVVYFEGGEITWIELDQFSPIPITPEWLERFGFEEIKHIDGYIFHTLSKEKIYIYKGSTTLRGVPVKHCEFVHQFQNLYFAYVGDEPKLKEI